MRSVDEQYYSIVVLSYWSTDHIVISVHVLRIGLAAGKCGKRGETGQEASIGEKKSGIG